MVGGVSCLGQCDRPPAVMINEQVYRGKSFDELRQQVQLAAHGERLPPQSADSGPLGWKIDPYDGQPPYDCVRKFVEAWQADRDTDARNKRARISDPILKTIETAKLRSMGARLSDVSQMDDSPRLPRECEVHDLQRRRKRAGHVQGSRTAAPNAAPGCGRDHVGRARHRGESQIHLHPARISRGNRRGPRSDQPRRRAIGASGPRIFGSELSHELDVFVSPGGYICGEETPLLEAMEDRRAEPRNKPPLVVFEGYQGKPTVINNVETYSWVPSILLRGGEWYRDQGTHGCHGLRFVSISAATWRSREFTKCRSVKPFVN